MTIKTALLVDDDELYAASLAQLLGSLCKVEAVNSIADALGRLDQRYFDFVISDFDLPEKSGLWLLAHIQVAHRSTIRILHSGRVPDRLDWLLQNKTIDQFVAKPGSFVVWRELLTADGAEFKRIDAARTTPNDDQ